MDVVEFAWEQVAVEEAYMEQVLKGFTASAGAVPNRQRGASKGESRLAAAAGAR